MRYISTRGRAEPRRFCEILLEGLAPDGGLYMPTRYPHVDEVLLESWRPLAYADLAFEILSLYIDDIPADDLRAICRKTYTREIFGNKLITPLKPLTLVRADASEGRAQGGAVRGTPDLYLQALSNGPTLAFKDLAMQLLGNLFEYELARRGEQLNILGATSGDTGSAAEHAMRGKKGMRVFMTSPLGRMSPFQQAQMFSLQDANIHNLGIRGWFDDCQDMVKAVSGDLAFKRKYKIGTVNSINWARLLAQVVYYFAGYFQATSVAPTLPAARGSLDGPPPEASALRPVQTGAGRLGAAGLSPEGADSPWGGPAANRAGVMRKVSFTVPSGNFGNVCAGHVARMMGLPIERLVVATNENDVLDEFFRTGLYRVRSSADTHETSSPSMDISKASNFERFAADLLGRDGARVRKLFGEDLANKGSFDLGADVAFPLARSLYGFASGRSTHAERLATIKDSFKRFGVMIDPHSADALKVAREHRQAGVPMIVMETALPIKFSATIVEALGREPECPGRFKGIEDLPRRVVEMDADVGQLKDYIARHCA